MGQVLGTEVLNGIEEEKGFEVTAIIDTITAEIPLELIE